MLYRTCMIVLVVASLSAASGCLSKLRDSKTEKYQYSTADGVTAGSKTTWPASKTTKDVSEQDLQKAKSSR